MLGDILVTRANWMTNDDCHVVVALLILCGARCYESYLLCPSEDSHVLEVYAECYYAVRPLFWCLGRRFWFHFGSSVAVLVLIALDFAGRGFDETLWWFFVSCAVWAASLDMGCLLTAVVLQLHSRMFDDAIRFAAWAKIIAFVDFDFWEANWELGCLVRLAFLYRCVYRFSFSLRSATAISDVARACRSKKKNSFPPFWGGRGPKKKKNTLAGRMLAPYRISFSLWPLCRG